MNTQTHTTSSIYRQISSLGIATSAALGIMTTLPSKATAIILHENQLTNNLTWTTADRPIIFDGVYAPENWTLTNTNADGAVDYNTNKAQRTVILTGGDNGSNLSGTTDWTIPINSSRAGTIRFNWSYFSLDTPGFDSAGFLLNGKYTPLAVKSGDYSTSPVSIDLKDGDIFSFRVETSTNTDGLGEFTISDIPRVNVTNVPEPLTVFSSLMVLGFGVAFKIKR
jgi:hypothetical protein